jgi:hypothetical protein
LGPECEPARTIRNYDPITWLWYGRREILIDSMRRDAYSGRVSECSIMHPNRTLETKRDRDKLELAVAPEHRERLVFTMSTNESTASAKQDVYARVTSQIVNAIEQSVSTWRAFTMAHLGLPPQRCRERALEAAWFLPEFRDQRKDGTAYWRKHAARYQELAGLAEEFLRAEHEYWQELELLSGQRQHFKPGLSDEARSFDDEVAA